MGIHNSHIRALKGRPNRDENRDDTQRTAMSSSSHSGHVRDIVAYMPARHPNLGYEETVLFDQSMRSALSWTGQKAAEVALRNT